MKKFKLPTKPAIMAICLLAVVFINQAQETKIQVQEYDLQTGFIYSPGIRWIENEKQDSVLDIIIEQDTMVAVRNLLIYCLQEKDEGDNARVLLSMINLDVLKGMMKSKEFDFYLKEYRKTVAKNKKYRDNVFPQYSH